MKRLATLVLLIFSLLPIPAVAIAADDAGVPVPTEAERVQLGISNYMLGRQKDGIWRLQTAGGEPRGWLINSKAFAGDVKGFGGAVPVFVVIGEDGTVKTIVAAQNQETRDFFDKAKALLQNWIGIKAADGAELAPDAISGATFSSTALTKNVQAALKAYDDTTESSNLMGDIGTVMLVLALVAGVVVVLWLGRKRKPSCCR